MKKVSLQSLYAYLTETDALPEVRAEIEAELNKDAERKEAQDALYASAKNVIMDELRAASAPVTIAELYDAVADDLPEGMTKGKVQYAITRLWKDEVNKVEGKINTYSAK